jgi:hypothetical protein
MRHRIDGAAVASAINVLACARRNIESITNFYKIIRPIEYFNQFFFTTL